jgi:hypothetical protein
MSDDNVTLEELAQIVADGFASVERKLDKAQLDRSEMKRDLTRLSYKLTELSEQLEAEQAFTSDLYENHEERIRALEVKPS